MIGKRTIRAAARAITGAGAVEVREVPQKVTNAEVEKLPVKNQPFLYASGNWGPGYITIKSLVGRKRIIRFLTELLAIKIFEQVPRLDFVAGNVTGGVIPGWQLSEELEVFFQRTIPFVYIREARKKGGQKELITGIANNPEIPSGSNGLVVEELVNFAQTISNGARVLRTAGYRVTHAATILFYNNPEAIKTLRGDIKEQRLEMIYLLTLPELLDVIEEEGTFSKKAIADYREFLKAPLRWQLDRDLKPVKKGGTI